MNKKSEGNHEHEHEFDGFTFEDIEKDFKFLADELLSLIHISEPTRPY